MPITDYISPQTLFNEGWVRADDQQGMLEKIDKVYLAENGYIYSPRLAQVRVSISKAAELVGISPATLAQYVTLGYLPVGEDGKVSMLEALSFDYASAKRQELKKKSRVNLRK